MQKRLSILLTVIIGASVNAAPSPAKLLKNLKKEAVEEMLLREKVSPCAQEVGYTARVGKVIGRSVAAKALLVASAVALGVYAREFMVLGVSDTLKEVDLSNCGF